MSAPSFRHDRDGTPESTWARVLAERRLPTLDLAGLDVDRVVVVGAHPDDETLGAGGLVRAAARAGLAVEVVTATAGEGSHPRSATMGSEELAALRRRELDDAVAVLAPTARTRCLDLPDGAVGDHLPELVAHLVDVVGRGGTRVLLCAPWRRDGHPDHEAVGEAAGVAARRTDAQLLEYPVWLWHWGTAEDLPDDGVSWLPLDGAGRAAKRAAVAAHASQVRPLSDRPGDEVLLGPHVLAHFDREGEVFLHLGPAADDALERVHRERPDPWDVDSSYERRKRAVTLASLPRERYGRALEVGCSVGALAVDLATRCDDLLAVDASPTAVGLARRRTSGLAHVEVRRAEVPAQWPDGRFDLVSVSEVGYFLSPADLREVVARSTAALTDDGHLLLCHWLHPAVGWPLDGAAVHEVFLSAGLEVLVEHRERDFLLHVLGHHA